MIRPAQELPARQPPGTLDYFGVLESVGDDSVPAEKLNRLGFLIR
jgi:hypothetical protein